jgi:toxin ParE1/3/4
MKAIVRDSALADLDGIYAWIAKDNPLTAALVIHRIFDSVDLLSLFPHIGHHGKVNKALEWSVPKLPYVIVYKTDDEFDELVVLAMFHSARNR